MHARLLLSLSLLTARALATEDCCAVTPAPTPAASTTSAETVAPSAPTGHPLRGVIVAVLPEKSALLVKHEEIPGVMSAMTMLLKVDAKALAAAKNDQAITATLVKKPDGWWLENVAAETSGAK